MTDWLTESGSKYKWYPRGLQRACRLSQETFSSKFLDFPKSIPPEIPELLTQSANEFLNLFDNMPSVEVKIFTEDSEALRFRFPRGCMKVQNGEMWFQAWELQKTQPWILAKTIKHELTHLWLYWIGIQDSGVDNRDPKFALSSLSHSLAFYLKAYAVGAEGPDKWSGETMREQQLNYWQTFSHDELQEASQLLREMSAEKILPVTPAFIYEQEKKRRERV